MHSRTRASRYRIATALLLGLLVLHLAACGPAHRAPSTSAGDVAKAPAPGTAPPAAAGPARGEEPPTQEPPSDEADAEAESPTEVEAEIGEYGPFPGEEVSEAPHDVLGEVAPEIEPELEGEDQETIEPDYDIPMVHNERVQFWIDFFTRRQRDVFEAGLVRSGRYMELFREIFAGEGLPLDLIYMAHVESGYKTTAYSHARARGIFQFIAGTGRRYGLRIDYWVDERLDPERSARAAVSYLKDLHAEFGDWHLALAAYNAGEGKIRRALARSAHDDFWSISRTSSIRRETKNYVPAILAAVMISKNPGQYGFEFEADPPTAYDSVEIEGAADLQVLARCAGTDLDTMKRLNPALRRYQTPPHATTVVRVPPGSAERTLAELQQVPVHERVLYARHRVRGGDTLAALARNYGVSVSAIQQANKMGRRTTIHVGDELIIPTVAAGSYPASSAQSVDGSFDGNAVPGDPLTYRVRRGDSLSAVAARYRTTVAAIAAASGIGPRDTLRPGQRLTVVPGVRSTEEARGIARGDAPGEDGAIVHVVRRGETLTLIARRYGTTPAALASANRMSANKLLQVGQRLVVRAASEAEAPAPESADGSADASADGAAGGDRTAVHTVRRGETLWRIASLYNMTVEELCALNRISRHTTLYPGTRLSVSLH